MCASLNSDACLGLDADPSFEYSMNAKWPFALSHVRLQTGGWAREANGTCRSRFCGGKRHICCTRPVDLLFYANGLL